MPKMNVAFALDAEELKRFDEWRAALLPPLARGPALVLLMDYMRDAQFLKSDQSERRVELDPKEKTDDAW